MSNSIEFHGKNVEQALEKASQELNVPVKQLKHDVLTYGSTGIFGLVGVKKAKIKVYTGAKETAVQQPHPQDKLESVPARQHPTSQVTETTSSEDTPNDDIIAFGIQALQTIVDKITEGATIQTQAQKDRLVYHISGGDSGVLIGKRGQTLESIQYLTEKMINKRSTHRIRVFVDVEGYLAKRKSNLQQMATRMAEKAKRIKKPVTIGQMNAHDRRIVHIHLKDVSGVRTQSIGDGYYRKLIIFPKKQGGHKRKNSNTRTQKTS